MGEFASKGVAGAGLGTGIAGLSLGDEEWEKKCQIIWKWESRLATEEISECRYKLSKFKSM